MRPIAIQLLKLTSLLCLLFFSSSSFAQCDVEAGDDVTICAGESTTIGGAPTIVDAGANPQVNWNNGAGNSENPSVSPSVTTSYTVTLTDDDGCDETDQITVTVIPSPTADFNFNPAAECAGIPVPFINTSTGTGLTYTWDFGNPNSGAANSSTQTNPSHVFVATGNGGTTFDVTLTVEADNGCVSIITQTVTVNESPLVVLNEDASFVQCLGIDDFFAYFNDASTPAVNANYFIDWGDGSPVYDSNITPSSLEHIYSGIDIWNLTYTVTGTNGCETTENYPVTNITNPAVGAATLGNTLQCGPVELCFDLNSYENNHPTSEYFIDFGDGSPIETFVHPPPTEVCHNYTTSACENDPPFYTFIITADNNCTPSTVTISPIQIYTPPIASFTGPPAACVGANVPFTNTSIGGYNQGCNPNANWTWDFGDPASGAANTSTGVSPSHQYSAPGIYTVTLEATNSGNPALACGTTEFTLDVCIETLPTPSFTLDEVIGCFPLESAVTNTSDDGIPCALATTWEVFYADLPCLPSTGAYSYTGGTNAASDEPVFLFQSVGIYDVVYEMSNTCGDFQDVVSVQVNTVPEVDVLPIANLCAGAFVSPSASILNCGTPILSYDWTMTGGSPSSAATLSPGSVTYDTDGNYTVTIEATNECGTTSSSEAFTVEPAPNLILSAADNQLCNGQSTTLTASGASNYVWSAAPGLISTSGGSATVQPSSTTTYTVTGTSPAGCPAVESITITVDPLPIVTPADVYEICTGECVNIAVDVASGLPPYIAYSWLPALTLDDPSSISPEACPPTTQNYTATVTDSNGCSGSGTVSVVVNPLPIVNAGGDIIVCDQPVDEVLTGYSPSGGTWSGPNVTPAGVFSPNGEEVVVLTYDYTDANGCENSDSITVTVVAPTIAEAGPDVEFCQSTTPQELFPDTPGGTWSGTDVTANGFFTPTTVGTYVLDYETGGGSCLSGDQITVEVWELPVADAGIDISICEGDSVQLNGVLVDGELPYALSEWTASPFLNDNTVLDPWASPIADDAFTLNVTDANGCQGTDEIEVFVLGAPVVEAGPNLTLCNQPIPEVLTGFSPIAGGGETGVWTGQDVTIDGTFTPSVEGIVTLYYTFTNVAGCSNVDSLTVTVADPNVADAGLDLGLCLNAPIEQLEIGGTWTGPNVTAGGEFTPDAAGTYDLVFTTGTGTCETSDDLQITVFELPTVDAGIDVFICEEDSIQLNAVAASANGPTFGYEWTGVAVSDPLFADPWVTPPATQLYSVTVTDEENCEATADVTVNVNSLPMVEAGPDLVLCDQPIPEVLTGFSPLPDITETGEWTGTGISDPIGEFTSPGVGEYTLYYTFTDIAGCTNLDSLVADVVAPVVADAGLPQEICLNNGAYQLQGFNPLVDATWSGIGIIDADLGTFDPLVSGEGDFTLTIEFGSGTCFSTDDMVITVLPLPVVTTIPDPIFCGNDPIDDLGAFSPAGGTWEGPSITDQILGVFDPSIGDGTYDVFYWYTDPISGCADTSNVTVSVSPVPVAEFTVDAQGCTNAPVNITNNSTGGNFYEWDLGDGELDNVFDPIYTYPNEGIYDIELVVENLFGCRDSLVISNEIVDPPTAVFNLLPAEGCAPLFVEFENESIGQYLTYEWDLAIDNSIDEVPDPLTYPQGDDVVEYTVELIATNYCGVDVVQEIVTVFPQPTAGFGTDYDEFCTPWDAQINNTSTGLPDVYEWDFGDNTTSGEEEPGSHVFFTDDEPTDYTITLITTNDCGTDTASYTITVLPNTVTAFFNTDTTSGCEPLTVEFTDFSDGGTVISYDFGDDNVTNDANPTHTFTEEGIYTIYQYVNNGCSFDTTTAMIEVFPSPDLDFTSDLPIVCEGEPVQFLNLSEDVNNVEWTFGDGGESDITNPIYTYQEGGTFDVTITATSMFNECTATLTQPFTVNASPDAEFALGNQTGCNPYTVTFDNSTIGGNFYTWDFGDDETAVVAEPTHTFINDTEDPISFDVTLIVQNLQLCADTFQTNVIVSPSPIATFELDSYETCDYPITVSTINTSVFADGYEWDFAPFGNANTFEPTVNYDVEGTWDISLTASNAYGCEDTATQEFTVHPSPTAVFTANPLDGCIPLPVTFTNASNGGFIYFWDFGDGGTSSGNSPVHTYTQPGVFDVTLNVISDVGCEDTMVLEDYISAYDNPVANFTFTPDISTIYNPEFQFIDESLDAWSWFWNFGDGYFANEANPVHSYEAPGTYLIELIVQNENGCESRDVSSVTIGEEFNMYVPNSFTPDGDNINDVFLPVLLGPELLDFYELRITDRWGVRLFESNDVNEPWLADFNQGKEYYVIGDVYIWQVKLRLKGAERSELITGHVTVIR